MDQNRQVDVGSLLGTVASLLSQNQGKLNGFDTGPAGGTHGERIAQAFQAAAQAASQSGTDDSGQQLAIAAQAMRQQGRGKAASLYANGLEEAAQQFQGRQGLSIGDLLPLLQGLTGGVRRGNTTPPGQGSILDALLPALTGFMNAKQQGLSDQQAATQAVGAAVSGAGGTIRKHPQSGGAYIDPGAASATNVIGGLVGALAPGLLGALTQGGGMGGSQAGGLGPQQSQSQGNDPLGGLGGLGGLLGALGQSGGGLGQPAQSGGNPLGGLGGLAGALGLGGLGGLMAGQDQQDGGQTQGGRIWGEPTN